jgi:hypothetical protein
MWLLLCCALSFLMSADYAQAQVEQKITSIAQHEEQDDNEFEEDFGEDVKIMLETVDIPDTEEIPRPVFYKPSSVEVFFRKAGLHTLFTFFNARDWCVKKMNSVMDAFKAMRCTL